MSKRQWCRICASQRPNDAFSRRGRRMCVCSDCQKLPEIDLERIEIGDELCGFVEQRNISEKNIARLVELTAHEDFGIREHAEALLDIARVHPRKKRRWQRLVETHCHLIHRYLAAAGDGAREYFRESTDWEICLALDNYEASLSASAAANRDIPF